MAETIKVNSTLRRRRRRPRPLGDRIFDYANYTFLILLMVVTLYPFLNTLAVSFNAAQDSLRGGIYLWPRQFTLSNYAYVFDNSALLQATLISVLRTIIGTVTAVFCSAMVAYTISRLDYVLRKFVTIAFILTMYINGGLIPTFLLMRDLGLLETFSVYILPGL